MSEEDELDDSQSDPGRKKIRSERKRKREEQRRIDIANAFDELASVVARIEPEGGKIEIKSKSKRKKSEGGGGGGDSEAVVITQQDLIERTVRIMNRLHQENKQLKSMAAGMMGSPNGGIFPSQHGYMPHGGGSGGGGGDVLVMAPSLSPANDQSPIARASYPHHPYYSQPYGPPLNAGTPPVSGPPPSYYHHHQPPQHYPHYQQQHHSPHPPHDSHHQTHHQLPHDSSHSHSQQDYSTNVYHYNERRPGASNNRQGHSHNKN